MNRLEKQVKKLSAYPTWVLSWVIGRVVPFTGTASLRFEKMTKNEVIISIKNRRKIRNHIHQVHAAAMVLLAETATGMVVGMNIPDDKIPLIKSMNTKFINRSTGAMHAKAQLTSAQIQEIHDQEKGETTVPVQILDETGVEPIIMEAVWAWIPKKKKDA